MDKKGFSRNFRYPSAELRDQVRAAVKGRSFRSVQVFRIAACEHEIRQGTDTEATEQFEARVAATLTNLAKQVQGLLTLAHAQVALTGVFLKYVITCVVEPPENALHGTIQNRKLTFCLRNVSSRIADHPINHVDDLFTWSLAAASTKNQLPTHENSLPSSTQLV